ncbi:BOI-related E3 ubiquitin-protein ligase 1-like [Punica granatum]|uniref:BOI-related E3 ubiquitin-protein ligase 1-like n=1 Tax=Punica granatum TaxID=22663 RepID=A0A218WKI2_PUNGR|nr:BOI-related E3 ubiquitin-protein ligase 1-like [Punica granatum]OWM72751.1 hypothetical protein CDL15_Pgr024803 [Punica granatum]
MAVEARHLDNLFRCQPQSISNRRDFIGSKPDGTAMYNTGTTQIECAALPLSTPSSAMPLLHHEVIVPPALYQSTIGDGVLPVKSYSGLTTFNNSVPGPPRKRSRDMINYACDGSQMAPQKIRLVSVDQDIALGTRRQQSDLDRLIAQQTERMRLEVEEKVRQQSKELLTDIHEGIARKLREKDEEIQRMGKLNWVMQERIKTLCVENQLLRSLAQTSEAAANTLRSNLEQVLAVAHVAEDRHPFSAAAAAVEEDAESCCASSSSGKRAAKEKDHRVAVAGSGSRGPRGACRGCGKKEPCVLLLPCRHLCLCAACGSVLHGCPVCGSVMTGTVHVNI